MALLPSGMHMHGLGFWSAVVLVVVVPQFEESGALQALCTNPNSQGTENGGTRYARTM